MLNSTIQNLCVAESVEKLDPLLTLCLGEGKKLQLELPNMNTVRSVCSQLILFVSSQDELSISDLRHSFQVQVCLSLTPYHTDSETIWQKYLVFLM